MVPFCLMTFLPSQMLYMNHIIWFCIFTQICGQNASFLPSTSITTSIGRTIFTFTVEFMNQLCSVKNVQLLILWVIFLPSCLMCLLFLKWFIFKSQKSSKSEHTAFVSYNNLRLDFLYALYIHFIMSKYGTGQKYEIPHGKPCLPSNCYLMPHAA